MKRFKVTNIDYDVDDEMDLEDLPKSLVIDVPDDLESEYEINEYISDEISNITNYLHSGFCKELK